MKRLMTTIFLLGLVAAGSGCAMCCAPDDDAYSAYGGKWERHDMYHGRVGSAFGPQVEYVSEEAEDISHTGEHQPTSSSVLQVIDD